MISLRVPRSQRGLMQYVVLGVLLVLAAGAIAFLQVRKAPRNDLTASLTGTGGVTISSPNNNATLTSPVHVIAYVASGFTGPVRTMQVFQNNTLVYQGPGTSVDTNVTLYPAATYNLTVLALKQNGQLEGSATVFVTVVTATPTPTPTPAPTPTPTPTPTATPTPTPAPIASLSPASFNFGSVTVGTTSPAQFVTITNTGTAGLNFTGAATYSSGFQNPHGGTCATGVTYAPGQSCTIGVQFAPTTAGTINGALGIAGAVWAAADGCGFCGAGCATTPVTAWADFMHAAKDTATATSVTTATLVPCSFMANVYPGYVRRLRNERMRTSERICQAKNRLCRPTSHKGAFGPLRVIHFCGTRFTRARDGVLLTNRTLVLME